MITPLLNTLRVTGGTLYTFSSASKDLSRVLLDGDITFSFSKFACINIPDITVGNIDGSDGSDIEENKLYIKELTNSDYTSDWTSEGINQWLAAHLQNYVLNFETCLLNDENFDSNYLPSVAEPIFFNWLKKLGAIDLIELTEDDKYTSTNLIGSNNKTYFKEVNHIDPEVLTDKKFADDRVIRYIGDIDITNQVDVLGDNFTELYLHIPSDAGNTPKVILKNNPLHKNFESNKRYEIATDSSTTNSGYIIGRTSDSLARIDARAFYDEDGNNTYDYVYSTIDSYGIDFDSKDYYDITSNTIDTITSIADYNGSDLAGNFEFNAILLYYTLYNKSTRETATNLYGVLFLDNVESLTNGLFGKSGDSHAYIKRYAKYKNNTLNGVNGNSFGLKVNLKFDTTPETTGQTVFVSNESSLTAMNMFCEALTELQKATSLFKTQADDIANLQIDVEAIKNFLIKIPEYSELTNTINILLSKINAKYNLEEGYGITIDTNDTGVVFTNSTSNYNVQKIDISLYMDLIVHEVPEYSVTINEGKNLLYLTVLNQENASELNLNLDKFVAGQDMKILFNTTISKDVTVHFIIEDYTFNYTIAENTNPTIEIICIDPDNGIYIIQ